MRTTLTLEDFRGNKDAYYNFKRSYQESVKKMKEASLQAGFFCPSEVFDMLAEDGMNIQFED